jgi:hypothetical protein
MENRNRNATSDAIESDGEPIGEPNTIAATIEFRADDDGNDGNNDRNGRINARASATSDAGTEPETADIPPSPGVKRRRSAPRIDEAATAVGGLVSLTSAVIAQRYGDIWLVGEQEANQLGSAVIKLLKHVPSTLVPTERLGLGLDAVALAGAIGAVFGTRMIAYRRQKALGLTNEQMAALINLSQRQQEQESRQNGSYPDGLEVPD